MPRLSEEFADEVATLMNSYTVVQSQESYNETAFGDGVLILENSQIAFRLVRDRGQVFVDVRKDDEEWVDAGNLLKQHDLHPGTSEVITGRELLLAIVAHSDELCRSRRQMP